MLYFIKRLSFVLPMKNAAVTIKKLQSWPKTYNYKRFMCSTVNEFLYEKARKFCQFKVFK